MKRILSLLLATIVILATLPTVMASERFVQVVPFKYDSVGDFSEGLAVVCIGDYPYKCGFIDKSGNEVIPLMYDGVNDFSEGLAAVKIMGKWGFIDKNGNEVIPIKYDGASSFSEGLAAVKIMGKWGFIDKDGNEIVPLIYSSVGNFSEGLATVKIKGKWGFIDKDGNEIVPPKYNNVSDFSEGRAAVGIGDIINNPFNYKWGFIDKDGNEVIPPKFHTVRNFSEGVAVVGLYNFLSGGGVTYGSEYLWGAIDKNGNEVVPLKYDLLRDFSEGLAVVARCIGSGTGMASPNARFGEYGAIDKNGNEVVPLKYDLLCDFSEGLAKVGIDHKMGFIDKSGNQVIPPIFDWYRYENEGVFSEGLVVVYIDGKTGFIDKFGNQVIPPTIFDYAYGGIFSEGMAAVSIGNWEKGYKWGFISFVPEKPSEWAQPEVTAAIEAGIVPEKLQVLYTQSTTRAEFCALAVMLYENIKGEITERATFNDTKDINVEKAAAIGVVKGVGDDKFAPNSSLTREQAATMLSRLADIIGKPLEYQASEFADNTEISDWAIDAVGQMQATGVMQGVGDNKFAPKSPYTREQSIMTVLRLYNIVKENMELMIE